MSRRRGRVSASCTTDIARGDILGKKKKESRRIRQVRMSCVGCTLNLKKDDGNKKTKVKNSGTWGEATRRRLAHSALGRMCSVTRHGSALGLPAVAPCCAGGGGALDNLHAGIFFSSAAPETGAALLDRFPFPGPVEKPFALCRWTRG